MHFWLNLWSFLDANFCDVLHEHFYYCFENTFLMLLIHLFPLLFWEYLKCLNFVMFFAVNCSPNKNLSKLKFQNCKMKLFQESAYWIPSYPYKIQSLGSHFQTIFCEENWIYFEISWPTHPHTGDGHAPIKVDVHQMRLDAHWCTWPSLTHTHTLRFPFLSFDSFVSFRTLSQTPSFSKEDQEANGRQIELV